MYQTYHRLCIVVANAGYARFVQPTGFRSFAVDDELRAEHGGEEQLAAEIAEALNDGARNGQFDDLLIVAPTATLRAISEHLQTVTRKRILSSVTKDLVPLPPHELWAELAMWIRPFHMPADPAYAGHG